MTTLARIAAILMLGLGIFHLYAAVLVFYYLMAAAPTALFIYGLSRESGGSNEWMRSAILLFILLSIIVYLVRWIVPALWRLKSWAWWSSLLLCAFTILGHVMPNSPFLWLITYCCLTAVILLWAGPSFLAQPAQKLKQIS